jgi:hypothetical protein
LRGGLPEVCGTTKHHHHKRILQVDDLLVLSSPEQDQDWQDPINWDWIPQPYTLRNLRPHLPTCSLQEVMPPEALQGRNEDLETVTQRYEDYARAEFDDHSDHPYGSVAQETRLILGVMALPRQLVTGTQKRLFGEASELVTTYKLHAIGHALFDPLMPFWGGEAWADVIRRAELMQRRRDAITAQVQELLELGR